MVILSLFTYKIFKSVWIYTIQFNLRWFKISIFKESIICWNKITISRCILSLFDWYAIYRDLFFSFCMLFIVSARSNFVYVGKIFRCCIYFSYIKDFVIENISMFSFHLLCNIRHNSIIKSNILSSSFFFSIKKKIEHWAEWNSVLFPIVYLLRSQSKLVVEIALFPLWYDATNSCKLSWQCQYW